MWYSGSVSGATFASTVNWYGGEMSGNDTLTGTMNWYGGVLDGPLGPYDGSDQASPSLTVAGGGLLALAAQTNDIFGILTNLGTVEQGGEVNVGNVTEEWAAEASTWVPVMQYFYYTYYTGEIWNEAGGLWELQGDGTMDANAGLGLTNQSLDSGYVGISYIENLPSFHNAGTLRKSAGTNTAVNVFLDNSGTVDVESGAMQLDAGGNVGGTFHAATNAGVFFDGGGFTGQGVVNWQGSGQVQWNGGSTGGSLTFPAVVNWYGGALAAESIFPGVVNWYTGNMGGTNTFDGEVNWHAGALSGQNLFAGPVNWLAGSLSGQNTFSGAVNWYGGEMAGQNTLTGTMNWYGGVLDGPLGPYGGSDQTSPSLTVAGGGLLALAAQTNDIL
jgi:hypothetical protein